MSEGRTRSARGQGFDSPQLHVLHLTEEQEKDLDEKAENFKKTKGSNKPAKER